MSKENYGSPIAGHGWCQACDYTTILDDYERKLIHVNDVKDWDVPIHVYCSECGHRHTSTPRDYFKNVDPEARLDASIRGIEIIEEMSHLHMNLWYLYLTYHLADTFVRKAVVYDGPLSHYSINQYSEIALKCSDILEDYELDKNNWVESKNAFPKGSLADIKPDKSNPNKIRMIDETVLIDYFYEVGIDIHSYPYSL